MLRIAFPLSSALPMADTDFQVNQPQFFPMKVGHRSDWTSLLTFNGLAGRRGHSCGCAQDFRLIFVLSKGQFRFNSNSSFKSHFLHTSYYTFGPVLCSFIKNEERRIR